MNSDQVHNENETNEEILCRVNVNCCFYGNDSYREYKEGESSEKPHKENVIDKQPMVSSSITYNLNDDVQSNKRKFIKNFLISCFGKSFDNELNDSLKSENVPNIVTEAIFAKDLVNAELLSNSVSKRSSRTKTLNSMDSSVDSADMVKTCNNETVLDRDYVNIVLLSNSPVKRSSRIKSLVSMDSIAVSADTSKTSSTHSDKDVYELNKDVAKPLNTSKFASKTTNLPNLNSSEQSSFSKKCTETKRYDSVIQLRVRDGSLKLFSTGTLEPLDCSAIYDDLKISKHLNLTYAYRETSPDSESASSKEFSSGSDNVFNEDNIPKATNEVTQSLRTKELVPISSSLMHEQFNVPSRTVFVRQTDIHCKPTEGLIEREIFDGDAERYIENSHGLCLEQTFSNGSYGSFPSSNTYNNTRNIEYLGSYSTTENFKTQHSEVKQIAQLVPDTQKCRPSSNSFNKDASKNFNFHTSANNFKVMKSVPGNIEISKSFTKQQEPSKNISKKCVQKTRHESLPSFPRKGHHLTSLSPKDCGQRNSFKNNYPRPRSASSGDSTVLTYYEFIDGPLANKYTPYSARGKLGPKEN